MIELFIKLVEMSFSLFINFSNLDIEIFMDYYNLKIIVHFQYFSLIYQFFLNFKFLIIYLKNQQKLYWLIPIFNNFNNKKHYYQLLIFVISLFLVL